MTITATDIDNSLKQAIRKGLADSYEMEGSDLDRDTAIYTAIGDALKALVPVLITQAMADPKNAERIAAEAITPMISELEDSINDAHDSPKTPDTERPGLRRAARITREFRRAIDEETSK